MSAIHPLRALADRYADRPLPRISALFDADPGRFADFSAWHEDLLLDWSKTTIDRTARAALLDVARAVDLAGVRDRLFAGAPINRTENRAAWHTALRAPAGEAPDEVVAERERFLAFAENVRAGVERAADNGTYDSVLSIGIGGSELGPAMADIALRRPGAAPRVVYLSNIDPAHFLACTATLDPRRTLVVVQSKTFSTIEVRCNAEAAFAWLAAAMGEEGAHRQMVAVSAAPERAALIGVSPERSFRFWDWVGGRYSVWSAIGLPLAIGIGRASFEAFLDGAHAMDKHFRDAPFDANLPVLIGLVGIWHRVVCGYSSRAIVPYDQRLSRLTAFLQQLEMESNGKSVDIDGQPCAYPTSPVIWGEPGTNAQHAFFQFLHQGTDIVPVEFIAAASGTANEPAGHRDILLANCLAQSLALMRGRESTDGHRNYPGNRPSVTLLHRRLDARSLGRLVALYEHRVFVEAQLLGINAFDQWGVELGKEFGSSLLDAVRDKTARPDVDASTNGLIAAIAHCRAADPQ